MCRRYKAMVIACTMLVLISILTSHAWAAGLHFTKEEIAIWRARKDNGPYKEEWTAILNRATAWRNNPDARWTGNTFGKCWPLTLQETWDNLSRTHDDGLRDSGFVYLVTGDTSYRDAVRKALLAQAAVPGTDWTNTTLWCPTAGNYDAHIQHASYWLKKITYGYSYIRDSLSSSDRSTLDAWFLAAAQYHDAVIHNVLKKRVSGRLKNDYTCTGGSSFCPGSDMGRTHLGGQMVTSFHRGWESGGSIGTGATVAAIAVLVNDATLKDRSKRLVKEWLKFAVFPDGDLAVVADQRRWNGGKTPQHGFLYFGLTVGNIISIVDHLARSGDMELYSFSTSNGKFGSEGGPKSLLKVLQYYAGLTNGTILKYASTTSTTNPDLLIKPFGPNQKRVEFVNITAANIFYDDPAIKQAYQTPLPSSWNGIGCDMLSGSHCQHPRIRIMLGQMENKVWPYPTTHDKIAPAKPTGLKIISGSQ